MVKHHITILGTEVAWEASQVEKYLLSICNILMEFHLHLHPRNNKDNTTNSNKLTILSNNLSLASSQATGEIIFC